MRKKFLKVWQGSQSPSHSDTVTLAFCVVSQAASKVSPTLGALVGLLYIVKEAFWWYLSYNSDRTWRKEICVKLLSNYQVLGLPNTRTWNGWSSFLMFKMISLRFLYNLFWSYSPTAGMGRGLFGFLCYMQVGGGLSGSPYYMHDGGGGLSGFLCYIQDGQEGYLGFSTTFPVDRRTIWASLLHAGWARGLSEFLCYMQNGQEDYLWFSATCMIRGELSGFMCYMQDGGGISGFLGYMTRYWWEVHVRILWYFLFSILVHLFII